MEYVTLPRTDIKVSRICLGCWQMNDNKANASWEAQPYDVSKAIVDKCLELGINFFDTAEGYAGSEEILGKCLQGRRQDAVIASKFGFRDGPATPPYTVQQIDESITKGLQKMQTSYIDLLQAHFPSFIQNTEEAITELKRQVSLGRIKSFGVCNFGPKNLNSLLDTGVIPVSNQICYNLLWRSAEFGILPICKEKDIAVLAYSPLQQGLLSGNYMSVVDVPMGRRRGKLFSNDSCPLARHGTEGCENEMFEALRSMKDICAKADVPMAKAALSWVLQQETCNKPIVIVGCRTPEQVVNNCNIIKLSDDVVKQLTVATEKLKEKLGTTLDQWATPDRCE